MPRSRRKKGRNNAAQQAAQTRSAPAAPAPAPAPAGPAPSPLRPQLSTANTAVARDAIYEEEAQMRRALLESMGSFVAPSPSRQPRPLLQYVSSAAPELPFDIVTSTMKRNTIQTNFFELISIYSSVKLL